MTLLHNVHEQIIIDCHCSSRLSGTSTDKSYPTAP